jgi:hypothetical protein
MTDGYKDSDGLLAMLNKVRDQLDSTRTLLGRVEDELKKRELARDDAARTPSERLLHAVEVEEYGALYFGDEESAEVFKKFRGGLDKLIEERDRESIRAEKAEEQRDRAKQRLALVEHQCCRDFQGNAVLGCACGLAAALANEPKEGTP